MKFIFALLALAGSAFAANKPEFSDVFIAGKDKFPSIRIPSVVVTKKGTVLAFAEGRMAHADQANNKIILKRSADGGQTWGALQIVADDGARCLNNPCAVVEQSSGRVLVMFQSYPAKLREFSKDMQTGCTGEHIVRSLITHSDDDGVTWSKFTDITASCKRPTVVMTVASGPGIGIQIQRGPHAGRLVMPFNERAGKIFNVYTVYSDDRGASWKPGENAAGGVGNEVQVVELSDGTLRLNSRRSSGAKLRKTSVSADGGQTWSKLEDVPDLMDPTCMASVLRRGDKLFFSGPFAAKRENGTIAMSGDDGKTWPVKKVLFPGSFAYSVLTALPDGTLGCLFETDGANRIVFARFAPDWLTTP